MHMTCPYCGSVARLAPNPSLGAGLPRYVLKCSGCAQTSILPESTVPAAQGPVVATSKRPPRSATRPTE
ncbi:transposase-like protein [Cryobacterium sp. CG_9.6]|nr:transposase-like protein [Cryobacterium sp. CG_9.6]